MPEPFHIQQLRARRSVLLAEARSLTNGPKISPLDERTFDGLLAQADTIQQQVQFYDLDPQQQRLRNGLGGESAAEHAQPHVRAFHNYLKHGMAGLSSDDRELMTRRDDPAIRAAAGTQPGSAGGFAVPNAAMAPLTEAMKTIGGILPFCTIIPSETGADLPIPTDNETAVEGEIITENSLHNEADIVLSQVVLQSFLYSSKIVRVSLQLMDDAAFDFGAYVMRKLGSRLGRITSRHWVTGDGASKPRGLAVAATVGKTAASATLITYDELVDVMHSVDPIYRLNGTWVMNDVTFAFVRKLKDTQGRPLYGDLANSAPNFLLGKPVSIDANMPSMTTGQKSILFGDLSNYFVRYVKDVRILRLEERYADFAQLGFLAFLRADGDLVDGGGGAVKALQQA